MKNKSRFADWSENTTHVSTIVGKNIQTSNIKKIAIGESVKLSLNALFSHDIHNRKAQGILNRTLEAARGLSRAARRELRDAMDKTGNEMGSAILEFVLKYRRQLAELLSRTQLAALLEGAWEVAEKVPPFGEVPVEGLPVAEQEALIEAGKSEDRASWLPDVPPTDESEDDVHLVTIDEAARNLAERNIVDRRTYDSLDAAARAKAFTVANVVAEETLTKLRDSLSRNVAEGADYGTWKVQVLEDVDDGTFLSDAHQETVFRTNVQTAFSDGQASVLAHPLVRSGFPYSTYDAIHDDRVREDHLALEELGIDGTNVYRNDDPVFQMFRPPHDYNCVLPGNFASGQVVGALKSFYSGYVIEILAANGAVTTLTINHPVLTKRGFVPAGQLKKGDNLLCHLGKREGFRGLDDVQHGPSLIEDIFKSLYPISYSESLTAFDFDGDEKFMMGEVDIVSTYSPLCELIPSQFKSKHKIGFVSPNGGRVKSVQTLDPVFVGHTDPLESLGITLAPNSDPIYKQSAPYDSATDSDRFSNNIFRFPAHITTHNINVVSCQSVPYCHRFGLASELDTVFSQPTPDGLSFNTNIVSELLEGFTGKVALSEIVNVRHFWYSGPVYDLETVPGYFTTNQGGAASIIIRNCRCGWTPITVRQAAELGVREANEWLETGVEPSQRAYVPMPPFRPPEGFRRSVAGAPLSIQLSLQPTSTFAPINYDDTSSNVPVISEILVALFGEDAEQVAEDLVGDEEVGALFSLDDNIDASFAVGGRPKVTRRYGKQPGPNWVSGGISSKGKQIWLWRSSGQPAPAQATPPTPVPPPAAPAPTAQPTSALQFTPVPTPAPSSLPAGGRRARATSIVAYNDAMSKLSSGQQLTTLDKTSLATKLTNMPTTLLSSLHSALGGSGAVSGKSAVVVSVRSILNNTAPAAQSTPPTPPPTPTLHKGANVIGGTPAKPPVDPNVQPSTPATDVSSGTPPPPPKNYYQPPPPNLVKAKPYDAAGALSSDGTIPTNINQYDVNSESKAIGANFTVTPPSPALGPNSIVEYVHKTSGHRVVAEWRWSKPAQGQAGSYRISVFDGSGQLTTQYALSQVDRDANYVEGRAAQVANWLDKELSKQASQKKGSAYTPPLAQFAYDYAKAAGVKPGVAPFKIDDDSKTNRAAIGGFLRSEFPKLSGAQQHSPHGGMDVVEHTMNIVDPANLRTAGLSKRDAELLRLGMVFHDVGKQHDPLDHEHPRKSAVDAEPYLWQFGLTPREVSDTLAVIKWHDAYGDAMKAGGGPNEIKDLAAKIFEYTDDTLPANQRRTAALRINNLLMRAYQSDVSTIPGLTSKPIPGRPDLQPYGFLDVDVSGPAFEAKVANFINSTNSVIHNKALTLPTKPPSIPVGPNPPDLVAKGKKWGEYVQRTEKLPVGPPTPYDSTVVPPPEVYDEARKNPDLNYARAFNMGYDGPTGQITTIFHGSHSSNLPGILDSGIRAGDSGDNAFGHGVYAFANGADKMTSTYASRSIVHMEVHTGRCITHDDLQRNVIPAWKKANPDDAEKLLYDTISATETAAALWAGYSTITAKYYAGEPFMVVLDPARIRIKGVVGSRSGGYKGETVKTTKGTVKFSGLTPDEMKIPKNHPEHLPTDSNKVPQGWVGKATTS